MVLSAVVDAWNLRMTETPAIVVSSTIEGLRDWPTVTVVSVSGDRLQYRTQKAWTVGWDVYPKNDDEGEQ